MLWFSFSKIYIHQYSVVLCQAARDGLLDIVESHIEMSPIPQIHTFDEDGYTALHHAARYNRVKVLEALIGAGGGNTCNLKY